MCSQALKGWIQDLLSSSSPRRTLTRVSLGCLQWLPGTDSTLYIPHTWNGQGVRKTEDVLVLICSSCLPGQKAQENLKSVGRSSGIVSTVCCLCLCSPFLIFPFATWDWVLNISGFYIIKTSSKWLNKPFISVPNTDIFLLVASKKKRQH